MDIAFQHLVERVRARDPEAAVEIVRLFEPDIHRFVRSKLRHRTELRYLDPVDISQSVWGGVFAHLVDGHLVIDDPEQFLHLLTRMAENNLRNCRRHPGRRAHIEDSSVLDALPTRDGDTSDDLCHEELLVEFRRRLSAEEQVLADGRAAGKDWQELADEVGGTPDAVRMQLQRAIRRICAQLGLDAVLHEPAGDTE